MELLKQEELTLMQNSQLNTIETNIKGLNQPVKWLNSWNFVNGLTEINFKTLMKPTIKHDLLSFKEVDLRPLVNKTIYKIKIKRF